MPKVGQRFGRWHIERIVGQGGFGVVYQARDSQLDRAVALKLIRPREDDDGGVEAGARFLREARLAASLSHPAIVTIFEVGEEDGLPYIAMEWIEGESLAHALHLRAAPLAEQLLFLATIAEAVSHAHGRNVIHRDLKPGNVLVTRDGRPKIVDFGLAKRTEPAARPHPLTFETRDDIILGTRSYMAPEQAFSSKVDTRADQFSFGVMAYELLTGTHPRSASDPKLPFPESPAERLDLRRPEVSEEAVDAIHAAMRMHPADRLPSMDILLRVLRTAAPAEPRKRSAGSTPMTAIPSSPSDANTTIIDKRRPRSSRGRFVQFILPLVVVLLFGGSALVVMITRGPGPTSSMPSGFAASPSLGSSPSPSPSLEPSPVAPPSILSLGSTPLPAAVSRASGSGPAPPFRPRAAHLRATVTVFEDAARAREAFHAAEPALLRCFLSERVVPSAIVSFDAVYGPNGDLERTRAHSSCMRCRTPDEYPSAAVAACVDQVLMTMHPGPLKAMYPVGVTTVGQMVAIE